MGKSLKGKELGSGFRQRKDGVYEARYMDRWGNRKSIYNKDFNELRREYAKCVAENELCLNVKQGIKVNDWFNKWLTVYKVPNVRPNTLDNYKRQYHNHVEPYIGECYMNDLVKTDIQLLFTIATEKGLAKGSQKFLKTVITDLFERAFEDSLISRNPAKGVVLGGEENDDVKALTLEEQQTFLQYAQNTFYEHLFYVALNTGLRPGELYALQKEDIDFKNRTISVTKTLLYQKLDGDKKRSFHLAPPKTKSSIRKVPMNKVCYEHMLAQIRLKEVVAKKRPNKDNKFIFVTKLNTPLAQNKYAYAIKEVINRINLSRDPEDYMEEFTGHTFRHTFATRCLEQGIAPKVVQVILGHSSIKTTLDIYTHVMNSTKTDVLDKLVSGTYDLPDLSKAS